MEKLTPKSVLVVMAETARETAALPPERRREFVRAEQKADPFALLPSKSRRKLASVIEHQRHERRSRWPVVSA